MGLNAMDSQELFENQADLVLHYDQLSSSLPVESNQVLEPRGGPSFDARRTNNKYICHVPGCNKVYGKASQFNYHLKLHKGELPFRCNKLHCGKRFTSSDELQKHRLTHAKDMRFQCPECSMKFTRRTQLLQHVKSHTVVDEQFECPECNLKFINRAKLNLHMNSHSRNRTKNSGRGDEQTNNFRNLTGEKLYVCPVFGCEKAFGSVRQLSGHQKCHSDKQPFVCNKESCQVRFSSLEALEIHQLCHNGKKTTTCPECSKPFTRVDNLMRHMKIHQRKSYWCPECNREFKNGGNFTRHKKLHQKIRNIASHNQTDDASLGEPCNVVGMDEEGFEAESQSVSPEQNGSDEQISETLLEDVQIEQNYENNGNMQLVVKSTWSVATEENDAHSWISDSGDEEANYSNEVYSVKMEPLDSEIESDYCEENNIDMLQINCSVEGEENAVIDELSVEVETEHKFHPIFSEENGLNAQTQDSIEGDTHDLTLSCNVEEEEIEFKYQPNLDEQNNLNVLPINLEAEETDIKPNIDNRFEAEAVEYQNWGIYPERNVRASGSRHEEAYGEPSQGPSSCVTEEGRFKCSVCNKTFSKNYNLVRHRKNYCVVEKQERKIQCAICRVQLQNRSHLANHLKLHTIEQWKLRCPKCKEIFTNRGNLTQHMKTHIKNNKKVFRQEGKKTFQVRKSTNQQYVCNTRGCNKAFGTSIHLKQHQRSHTPQQPLVCTWSRCRKSFSCLKNLKRHQIIHTAEKLFSCPECQKTYTRRDVLNKHFRSHMKKRNTGYRGKVEKPHRARNVNLFYCRAVGCCKVYTMLSHLNAHQRVHMGKPQFKCPFKPCRKKFSCDVNLKRHILIHTAGESLKCQKCGLQFSRKDYLTVHMKKYCKLKGGDTIEETINLLRHIKTETSEPDPKQPKRKKKPTSRARVTQSNFSTNMVPIAGCSKTDDARNTTSGKRFFCHIPGCNKVFDTALKVKSHQRCHAGYQKFVCNWENCGRTFGYSNTLQRHLSLHKGETKYQCSFCQEKFYRRYILVKHMEIHTAGGKKGGSPKSNMNHLKTDQRTQYAKPLSKNGVGRQPIVHTGSKTYLCSVCKKGFSKLHYFDKHIKIHANGGKKVDMKAKSGIRSKRNNMFKKGNSVTLQSRLLTKSRSKENRSVGEKKRKTSKAPKKQRYYCRVGECDKVFGNPLQLKAHRRMHTIDRPFTCSWPHCGKSFTRIYDLKRHLCIHTGQKNFPCPLCKKAFFRVDHLTMHIRAHTPNENKVPKTNKKLTKKGSLNRPQTKNGLMRNLLTATRGQVVQQPKSSKKVVKGGNKITAPTKSNRKETVKGCSSGDKKTQNKGNATMKNRHICNVPGCKKVYALIAFLIAHKKYHTKQRPFVCRWAHCEKNFPRASELEKHEHIHTKERFACLKCKKKFTRKYNLNNHLQTHTTVEKSKKKVNTKKTTRK